MKLSEIKVDVAKREEGEWVENIPDLPGLSVRVRGVNTRSWRKLQNRLVQATPRHKRMNGGLDPEETDRINGTLLLECALLDWKGIEDEEGKAVPYSKEQAKLYLLDPAFERFRDGVFWAASMVGERHQTEANDTAKNS